MVIVRLRAVADERWGDLRPAFLFGELVSRRETRIWYRWTT